MHRRIRFELHPDGGDKSRSRQLLVNEKALAAGQSLRDSIVKGCDVADDGKTTPLSSFQIDDFLGMGFRGAEAAFRTVNEQEKVVTALGEHLTRHVVASSKTGLEYHCWLTDAVPFGWAQLEIWEKGGNGQAGRVRFQAKVAATGTKPK
jgi:hypothetical protein